MVNLNYRCYIRPFMDCLQKIRPGVPPLKTKKIPCRSRRNLNPCPIFKNSTFLDSLKRDKIVNDDFCSKTHTLHLIGL